LRGISGVPARRGAGPAVATGFTGHPGPGRIAETAEDATMGNIESDLRAEVARLTAENEKLKKLLEMTRAQRAEYLNYLCELMPPVELPTEEEMIEQMKHLVPADEVLRKIREARERGE
jgi:hypothetical protein